jgi:hypothetical protein
LLASNPRFSRAINERILYFNLISPAFSSNLVNICKKDITPGLTDMETLEVDPTESPVPRLLLLKLISSGFSFFVAGINDGSLGALIPYIRDEYDIDTNMASIV